MSSINSSTYYVIFESYSHEVHSQTSTFIALLKKLREMISLLHKRQRVYTNVKLLSVAVNFFVGVLKEVLFFNLKIKRLNTNAYYI